MASEVHRIKLKNIGKLHGYPYEDRDIALCLAGMRNINIDNYPELLIVRDIFQRCIGNPSYERFIRATVKDTIISFLDGYILSRNNRVKSNYNTTYILNECLNN